MTAIAGVRARPRKPSLALRVARLSGVALLTLVVAYAGISVRVAEGVTHVDRQPVGDAPRLRVALEDVSFRTSDGLVLRGWLYRTAGDRAVVFVHGKDSNRLEGDRFERLGELLLTNGYSVLTFDMRGHGASEGDRFSLGQFERHDVAAAVDFLGARGFAAGRVALLGESMGAGTVLQSVAVRPDVGPVVSDSAYADGREIVEDAGPSITGLPRWFNPGIELAARLFGLDVDAVRPAAIVRAHPERPYLFIHCELDRLVPAHHGRELGAASANPGTVLWMAPACGHVQAYVNYPSEYESRLLAFLAANLR